MISSDDSQEVFGSFMLPLELVKGLSDKKFLKDLLRRPRARGQKNSF